MLNPNDIREIAVLTHESIVRSSARRVRSTASLVAALALVESPPAMSVTESDPWLSDQGLCAHEPARSASSPSSPGAAMLITTGSSHHRSVAHPLSTPPPGSPHPSIAGAAVPGRDAPGTTFEAAVTGVALAVTDSTSALNGRRTQRRAGCGNRRGGQNKRNLAHHDAPTIC